ncbi:DUF2975 domain-containing protein [Clostridium niameyense]|uniref:DUF2975 domain-containing protein n=1 Tax=Clostridium niameyense TaxID=1622073 RepID=A0A6M0RAT7_9CLOT|nr:DUF2975 domain-containing protein [Clostridium niameyense]NEZ47332.1 DUF2975 domain-containing protein [Clostridium niameyense]
MRENLIKISKVILTVVKICAIVSIFATIFWGFLKELPKTNQKGIVLLCGIGSIIYSIFYYLIANNIIFIINNSRENPFIMDIVKRFDRTGIYLMIISVMDYIKNHSNILRTDTNKVSNVGFILLSGIMCFVISNIIYKAIKIKYDNDLTI